MKTQYTTIAVDKKSQLLLKEMGDISPTLSQSWIVRELITRLHKHVGGDINKLIQLANHEGEITL